jgi:hypothetical protein
VNAGVGFDACAAGVQGEHGMQVLQYSSYVTIPHSHSPRRHIM